MSGATYKAVLYAEATYAGGAAAPAPPTGVALLILAYPPIALAGCCSIPIDEGQVIECPASIYQGETAVDPAELVALTRAPSGAIGRYEYGSDPALARLDVGHYSLSWLVSEGGDWSVHWEVPGQAAREISFPVNESVFV
jgi:hypothetical protein